MILLAPYRGDILTVVVMFCSNCSSLANSFNRCESNTTSLLQSAGLHFWYSWSAGAVSIIYRKENEQLNIVFRQLSQYTSFLKNCFLIKLSILTWDWLPAWLCDRISYHITALQVPGTGNCLSAGAAIRTRSATELTNYWQGREFVITRN